MAKSRERNMSRNKIDVPYLPFRLRPVCIKSELRVVLSLEPYISAELGGGIISNSRGVFILFNNNFEYKILRIKKMEKGTSFFFRYRNCG